MKQYLAEAIGTFALVFAGTGAIVIDEATGGRPLAGAGRSQRQPG